MKKRRITLNLDEDVIEALEAIGGRSLSLVANEALAEALESKAHRAAFLRWLDELDEQYGKPDAETLAAADALIDLVQQGGSERLRAA